MMYHAYLAIDDLHAYISQSLPKTKIMATPPPVTLPITVIGASLYNNNNL